MKRVCVWNPKILNAVLLGAYISGSRFLTHAEDSALRRKPFRENFIIDAQHASLYLLAGVLGSNRGEPVLSQEHRLACLDVLGQVNIIHLLWREFSWCGRLAGVLYKLWQVRLISVY